MTTLVDGTFGPVAYDDNGNEVSVVDGTFGPVAYDDNGNEVSEYVVVATPGAGV